MTPNGFDRTLDCMVGWYCRTCGAWRYDDEEHDEELCEERGYNHDPIVR